ncbi:MAG TPA: UxaA family hydrolase, partial [Cyclobacteriaceae bacterium]|nr:UxaA family hydrolase [Cyclobacteriaceae bacterium]
MNTRVVKINPADTVWVALTDLASGEKIDCNGVPVTLAHAIPAKHKFVERTLQPGEEILMYGVVVGKAIATIPQGGAITTQNVKHEAAAYAGRTKPFNWQAPDVSPWKNKTFLGYPRPDGQVGTANYWIVIPLVFCENRNVNVIREAFEDALGFGKHNVYKNYVHELVQLYKQGKMDKISKTILQNEETTSPMRLFKNLDGIKFLTHEGGCGGTRQDSDALCALLAGYINNPNVAGATVLSLGCQHAQASILRESLKKHNPAFAKPLIVLEQQTEGTEQELLARAIRETFVALTEVDKQTRQPVSLTKLVVGLECGGSDGFSGISANPAIGHTSDLIAALGGATILSEFPELCGVEQELINRTTNDTVANRFTGLMRAYSRAAESVGSGFDMNPSPGNI